MKPAPIHVSDGERDITIYTTLSRGKPLYQACYYFGGARVRKSFADIQEAKRFARMQLGQLGANAAEAERLSSADLESLVSAKKTIEETGLPLHVAIELFTQAHKMLGGESVVAAVERHVRLTANIKPQPFAETMESFVESRRQIGVCEQHITQLHKHLRMLRDEISRPVLEWTTEELDNWLSAKPWKPQTKANAIRMIRSLANWCKKRGIVPKDWEVADNMQSYQDTEGTIGIFTPDQMREILFRAKPETIPYLAIAAFAGLRSAELKRLDWRHVYLDRGFIEAAAAITKTRRRRLVPIPDNLRAWLEPHARRDGPVFVGYVPGLTRFMTSVGVSWVRNGLRHSYISYRLAVVHDAARVALECGNSPGVIFKHYRELVTPEQAEQWFSICPDAH